MIIYRSYQKQFEDSCMYNEKYVGIEVDGANNINGAQKMRVTGTVVQKSQGIQDNLA